MTYATILLGVQRAGFTPFAVSPRNSATAVAHLLTKTQADVVLVGPEPAMQDLAAAAFEIMRSADTPLPHQALLPLFHEIYLDVAMPFEPLPPTKWSLDDPGIILHSSGGFSVSHLVCLYAEAKRRFHCVPEASYMDQLHAHQHRPSSMCVTCTFSRCLGLTRPV